MDVDDQSTNQNSTSEPLSDQPEASSSTPIETALPYPWDIGLLVSGKLSAATDSDRYHYLTHVYQGTEFGTCEVVKNGKHIQLKFQASWPKEFEWLSSSPSEGEGFCKYCVLFKAKIGKGYLSTLVKTPFKRFNKAKGKDGVLTTHAAHQHHHDAMLQGKAFLATYTNPETRVDAVIDRKGQEHSNKNKFCQ